MHCRPLVPFLFAAALPYPTLAQSPATATTPVPGSQLPIVAEHHYSVTARVRILLWWYSRDDVGLARLRWRAENERRGFELLIASDPARAPRHINQWGYVAEEVGPGGATLLGVGKDTDPKSVEEAKNGVKAEGEAKQFLYKAIRTEVTGATGRTGVIHFALPRDPTYRDLDSVIAQLPAAAPSPKEYALLPGVGGSYLPTLQRAVDDCVTWYERGRPGQDSPVGRVRPYVYDGKRYELVVRSSKTRPTAVFRGHSFSDLIQAEFVITNTITAEPTRFQIDVPRSGSLKGVPVHVIYRPRWWFEVEIVLDDATS